jgi:hypothetical protein
MGFAAMNGYKKLAKNNSALVIKNPADDAPAGLIEEEIMRSERKETRRRRV